jgi:hypothetical protein
MSTTKRACLAWAACAAAMAASFTYGLAGVNASRSTDASIELTPGTTIDLTVFRFFEDDLEFVLSFTDHCAELGSWVGARREPGLIRLHHGVEVDMSASVSGYMAIDYEAMSTDGVCPANKRNQRWMTSNLSVAPGVWR